MAIQRLNQGTPTLGASVPFYDPTNGVDRKASLTEIFALNTTDSGDSFETQYFAPSATGFSVTISPSTAGGNVYLLLTPAAGYAAGTMVLPEFSTCIDKQEVLCASTQSVATFTMDGNGSVVNGAPGALSANDFFRMRWDGLFQAWYRVG